MALFSGALLKCALRCVDPADVNFRGPQNMIDRSILAAGIGVVLISLLSPVAAFASVKCQCNNGTLSNAMDADYGDDDADEACNDACSEMGGGRVWNVDTDQEDGDDVTIRNRERHHEKPAHRR